LIVYLISKNHTWTYILQPNIEAISKDLNFGNIAFSQ